MCIIYIIMAKPKDCGDCHKPATIHLTQIINNEIKKLDFCEDCPHQKGVTDPEGFSLAELLAHGPGSAAGSSATSVANLACPECGHTARDFKKTGLFGCPSCYETFQEIIEPMLEGMHRGLDHSGKVPQKMLQRVGRRRELEKLRRNLDEAVSEERFEDAAKHRDALRALQEGLASGDSEASQS